MHLDIKKLMALSLVIFSGANFAANKAHIHLQIHTEQKNQDYMKKICLTKNNGFTKSCGTGALIFGGKHWQVTTFNLKSPLGTDNSCYKFQSRTPFPESDATLSTTLVVSVSNHIKTVILTDCKLN